jgi:adenylate cyclase
VVTPVLAIIAISAVYVLRIAQALGEGATAREARTLVLKAPRFLGATVAGGWVASLLVGLVIDFFTVRFPIPGERVVYYGSSALAMLSTGLFGYLITSVVTDHANRKRMVPQAFPEGMVSRIAPTRPVSLPARHLALWFGVSFFPLLVLALGIYTRNYVPANEFRAYLFITLFMPTSFFMVYRVGKGIQQPLYALVDATRRIGDGNYDLAIKSRDNDELAFLIDSTIEMSASLREKELLSDTFGRSVDPRVRDHLLAGNIDLGGTLKEAAVMFCDIRGFTTFSEGKREEEIVAVLNEHFEAMDAAIGRHDGMINKFLGDGFLALFGLPLEAANPCNDAFLAALEMVAANDELNRRREARGDSPLDIGVGLHYGPLVAGNIGSYRRSEYTVIGDAVNVASRIEGLTKRFGTRIVVTERFASLLPDETVSREPTDLGRTEVRGRTEPVQIYGAR